MASPKAPILSYVKDITIYAMKNYIPIIWLALLCVSCGVSANTLEAPTATRPTIAATSPPSPTLKPSETPLPPPTKTFVPIAGVTLTQVNVRAGPSKANESLGVIPMNVSVEIIGKDLGGNWWLIVYPQAPIGQGWVTSEYVAVNDASSVPVVKSGSSAVVQQQVNVRSGPGVSFNSLGVLNVKDTVWLTGKDAAGAWLQIEFASGPQGKGWVNAAFMDATDIAALSIVSSDNELIGTATPPDSTAATAPAERIAPEDGDSASAPAASVTLSLLGTRSFQYSSDVSSPTGDAEDWIQFVSSAESAVIRLECQGSESYIAEVIVEGKAIQNLVCGETVLILTAPALMYVIRFQSAPMDSLQYTRFTMTVKLP